VQMGVSTEHSGDLLTVAVTGDVDVSTAPALAAAIAEALDANTGAEVCVDLSGVNFLDSSGIAALLRGRRGADERGVAYRVAGAHGITRQVLELTGVWAHLSGDPEPDPSADPAS
jgi:anti-sigma B factor antagonist